MCAKQMMEQYNTPMKPKYRQLVLAEKFNIHHSYAEIYTMACTLIYSFKLLIQIEITVY